jgi:hypothetical protein
VFQSALPDPTDLGAGAYADAVSGALVPAIVVMVIGTAMTWLLVRAPSARAEPPTSDAQYRQHHRRFHL